MAARPALDATPAAALALSVAAAAMVVLGSLAFALREKALSARLTRLADAELVRVLQDEARSFWPADPERLPQLSAWMERAGALLARTAEHRRSFEELERGALQYEAADRERDQAATREELATAAQELDGLAAYVEQGDRSAPLLPAPEDVRRRAAETRALLAEEPAALLAALRARIGALRAAMQRDALVWRADVEQLDDFERLLERSALELSERATFRFSDPLDAWRHEALRRLLADLERLAELVPRVSALRTETEELARLSDGGGAALWERACAAVSASPRYGGLELAPLFGLAPLGEDPESGLWEFLLLASGEAPPRDENAPGGRRIEEGSGVVLVLLPGGRFRMGQRDDEGPPLVTARPAHVVELAPFFLSRYELTVAQAERLGGFPAEKTRPADGRLPLVLDWERSRALLRQHGLELPTEAQWEYAARALDAPIELERSANVFDLARNAALREERTTQFGAVADFDDGFPSLAPVGSFRPNAFGLHDTLGNVSEWCLDHFVARAYSTLAPRVGDGLRATVVSAQLRAVRGGSYAEGPNVCQVACRTYEVPSKMPYAIGLRPVRALPSD